MDSIGLIEVDKFDDCLFVWQYPSIDDKARETATLLSQLANATAFIYSKLQDSWIYCLKKQVSKDNATLSIKNFSVIVLSNVMSGESRSALV
jgi:hypothetical protein